MKSIDASIFEIIAVSVGFDTHSGDLASLGLTENSYREIGKRIATIRKPTFFVLEGGYMGEANGKDIDSFLKGYEENRSSKKTFTESVVQRKQHVALGLLEIYEKVTFASFLLPSCLVLRVFP